MFDEEILELENIFDYSAKPRQLSNAVLSQPSLSELGYSEMKTLFYICSTPVGFQLERLAITLTLKNESCI